MTVAVVGAGAWGSALAHTLAVKGLDVALWVRDPGHATDITRRRVNDRHLPGIALDPSIRVDAVMAEALHGADIVIMAVPTHAMRDIAGSVKPHLGDGAAVVSAAKGFEVGTDLTMTAVLGEILGEGHAVAALSGPNIAPEIARGLPAATVVAAADPTVAETLRDTLNGPQLRVYSSDDVIGVEFGGALKNVVAIAAGACDGMEMGDNGKAAIITRGLVEIARLGTAAGAQPLTFAGLTGLGDCIVTCTSALSRNRRLGEALARGATLGDAVPADSVAEGINAARVAVQLAVRHGVDMPIAAQVHAVLFENRPLTKAFAGLMARGAVAEMHGLGLDDLPRR